MVKQNCATRRAAAPMNRRFTCTLTRHTGRVEDGNVSVDLKVTVGVAQTRLVSAVVPLPIEVVDAARLAAVFVTVPCRPREKQRKEQNNHTTGQTNNHQSVHTSRKQRDNTCDEEVTSNLLSSTAIAASGGVSKTIRFPGLRLISVKRVPLPFEEQEQRQRNNRNSRRWRAR